MTPATTLDVRYDGRLVGRLEHGATSVYDLTFRYDGGWAADPGSFPLSLGMPLQVPEHPSAVVYPWFLNLLPEGSALQTVGHILKVSELDVFAMLQTMGGDLPGALTVSGPAAAAGTALRPRYRRLSESELADALRRLPERPLLVGEDGVQMSLAGAQDKLAVVRYRDGAIGLPLDGAPSTYILKPRHPRLFASVENEAYCMRLAEAVKIPVARVHIGRAEDIEYLLVERYDREPGPQGVQRVHQEDLCQALGMFPYAKYEWNAHLKMRGPTVVDCMAALDRTPVPALNKARFFDLLLFNILVDNVDAHAKNYSLLIRGRGDITMAPLYDVMHGRVPAAREAPLRPDQATPVRRRRAGLRMIPPTTHPLSGRPTPPASRLDDLLRIRLPQARPCGPPPPAATGLTEPAPQEPLLTMDCKRQ